MPTTPINGLPVPDDNSPNSPPIHFDALADQLDTRLVPRFANVAARDAAITAPVPGQMCHIAVQASPYLPPRLMVYQDGQWRLVGPSPLAFVKAPWTEAAGYFGNAIQELTRLSIPDPGFGYRLGGVIHCEMGADVAGTRWDLWAKVVGSTSFDMDRVVPPIETMAFQRINIAPTDQVMYGACTVILEARRAYGTGLGQITANFRRFHIHRYAG